MDRKDSAFRKRLLETFRVEALEHVSALSSGLLELEKAPPGREADAYLERIFREAHSLKGAARAVNEGGVESLCQAMESIFSAMQKKAMAPSQASFDVLHEAVSLAGRLSQALSAGSGPGPEPVTDMLRRLAGILEAGGVAEAVRTGEAGPATVPAVPAAPAPRTAAPPPPEPVAAPPTETVRIATAKLDALLNQAEELFPLRLAADQLAADLGRLHGLAAAWKKQWARIQHEVRSLEREQAAGDGDRPMGNPSTPIGKVLRFLEWNRTFMETLDADLKTVRASSEQGRQTLRSAADNLMVEVRKTLMLPFRTVLEVFPKLVRDLAREQGKEIALTMQGGDIEIDKRILFELKDPLVHLVRNCADHGIEKPEDRIRKGKPAGGTIAITVTQKEGNLVEVVVSDDGAGMDPEAIKAEALKRGAVSEAAAAALAPGEILDLAFRSGISTSPQITSLSGRGLGLAIVREKLESLDGSIALESAPGRGTLLRMLLPVSLAAFRSVLVRVGDARYAIPASGVLKAARAKPGDLKTLESREAVVLDGQAVSLVRLAEVLKVPARGGSEDGAGPFSLVVLGSGEKCVAFRVDEVLGGQELMMKSLGSQLQRVRNVGGAAILASGKVIPVLNVPELIRSAIHLEGGAVPAGRGATEAGAPAGEAKSILVVEDSITSRTLLKNILESAGFRVETAVDGLDGLSKLAAGGFHAVVSDVDMPRMNGLELTSRIRADRRFSSLPVVLVTSLESRKDHERGFEVGAQAYIVKTRFDQGGLIDTLRRLL